MYLLRTELNSSSNQGFHKHGSGLKVSQEDSLKRKHRVQGPAGCLD